MSDLGTKGFVTEKVYPANGQNVQDVAYELAKYLDNDKHLITQTMRTSDGYLVQCKGDASMEWTKYLGMDAAVSTRLSVEGNNLRVTVRAEKWVEKAGIAALGVFFAPLLVTSGSSTLSAAIWGVIRSKVRVRRRSRMCLRIMAGRMVPFLPAVSYVLIAVQKTGPMPASAVSADGRWRRRLRRSVPAVEAKWNRMMRSARIVVKN